MIPAELEPAAALLDRLTGRGVILTAADGGIAFDAPPDTLTPEDRAALRSHKPQLLALQEKGWWAYVVASPCSACGDYQPWVGPDGEGWCPGCWADAHMTAEQRAAAEAEARALDERHRAWKRAARSPGWHRTPYPTAPPCSVCSGGTSWLAPEGEPRHPWCERPP